MTGNARIAAVRSVVAVLSDGQFLDAVLPATCASLSARDRALAQEISYGVLRWYHRLAPVLDRLLHRPMGAADMDVRVLVLGAMHEIENLRTPDHAAVSEAVAGARLLGKQWATGFVNALLRRFLRERENLWPEVLRSPSARYAHPDWLIEAIKRDWPQHWESVLECNNQRPPMDLRVNLSRTSRSTYIQSLADAGISARPVTHGESGVRLETPVAVQDLPGFATGLVSIQDQAAQLAAPLLGAQSGQHVLDACAAPGGKVAHILETACGGIDLVAVDRGPQRVALLRDTLRRLGLSATVVDGDARDPGTWWDGRHFHRILLDAPCSATGVIRRHPDIKHLRKPEQIGNLTLQQFELLEGLWPVLARGGRLLYATCSVLREENDGVIEKFTSAHKDARVLTMTVDWGEPTNTGRQTLPPLDDTDGFYYAMLERC